MIARLDDKICIGSFPLYGQYGGAITVFNPQKEKVIENYGHIVRNHGIVSLVYESETDLVFGGSNIFGGGGARPIEKEARLFAWNPRKKKKVLEVISVHADVVAVSLEDSKGKVFGASVMSNTLFVFDQSCQKVIHKAKIPFGRPHQISLKMHRDGYIYLWFS